MNKYIDEKNSMQNSALSTLPPTDRCLPIALMRAREKVIGMMRQMLAASGVSEQQWRVLRVLSENGPLGATHLAERTGMLLPSLTRIIQSLETRGLLSRARDIHDRRRHVLAITPSGQTVIDDNEKAAGYLADQFVEHLGVQRYDDLLEALALLEVIDVPIGTKRS